jgi:hypothetical protein
MECNRAIFLAEPDCTSVQVKSKNGKKSHNLCCHSTFTVFAMNGDHFIPQGHPATGVADAAMLSSRANTARDAATEGAR